MGNLSRLFLFILLCMTASAAFALDVPDVHFFQPVEKDLSIWYLGNIFGSDLVPGSNVPDIKLLGTLFGVFNQVVLVVTIIIVAYTIGTGTLNTAAQGKPLGEKWNAVWLPIRIVAGIAALVPKAGTGYCLAQYMVMWLIIQGVGAADTLWSKMLDYFEAGGAITAQTNVEKPMIFSYDTMNYTYSLQTDQLIGGGSYGAPKDQATNLLKSMVCIQAYNNDPANAEEPKWVPYLGTMPQTVDVPAHPILLFGDQQRYNARMPVNKNQTGAECGYVQYKVNFNQSKDAITKEAEKASIYINAMYMMAKRLDGLALLIVTEPEADDGRNFPRQYVDVQRAMQMYVNYIVSYRNILGPVREKSSTFALYKQYGWILAGNYYSVLANFNAKATLEAQQFVLPVLGFTYGGPISKDDPNGNYKRASNFYTPNYFTAEPEPMYAVPGSEYMVNKYPTTQATGPIRAPVSRAIADNLRNEIEKKYGGSNLGGEVKKRVDEFMKYLSGEGSGSGLAAQNPIMSAAKYGKMLTEVALTLMIVFGTTWTVLTAVSASAAGTLPFWWALSAMFSDMVTPMILALGGFMYAQGAVLGIFIPMIPYVTFLTGVIGFMMSCVESVAAAPLVAMGLIFPETKDEIWGRAAPAYMLILNLFLRPSLMIIGFAAAMILMWIMTEVLNIGFRALLGATFAIEGMFGFVSILTAYVMLFTYIVTEVYSLINVLPNRVLAWVGDQSMGVKPAKEAIAAGKQGTEAGSGAVVGGLEASQKADMWRASEHLGQRADLNKERDVIKGEGKLKTDAEVNEEAKRRLREKENAKDKQSEVPDAVKGRPK